jgi:methyl-accepting chemotaxis protein
MATKTKIALGFFIMILLITGVSSFGYLKLQEAADGFDLFERYATINTASTELDEALGYSSNDLTIYLSWGASTADKITSINANLERAIEMARNIGRLTRFEDRRRLVEGMAKDLEGIKGLVAEAQGAVGQVDKALNQELKIHYADLVKQLDEIVGLGKNIDNARAMYLLAQANNILRDLNGALTGYSEAYDISYINGAEAKLPTFQEAVNAIGPTLITERGQQIFTGLAESMGQMAVAFQDVRKAAALLAASGEKVQNAISALRAQTRELSARMERESKGVATDVRSANSAGKTIMLTVIGVGVLLGVLITTVIIMNLISVLGKLSNYAKSIAAGEFSHQVDIREKGEIGVMVNAMRQIPAEITRILDTTQGMVSEVTEGKLGKKLDESQFPGNFSGVARAVNNLSDAFNSIVDVFPPFMAANAQHKIIHLNSTARKAMGGNWVSESCAMHLNAPECGKAECIGTRAMTGRTAVMQETQVTLGLKKVDVAVTAMPIIDAKDTVVGFYEFLTDISGTKMNERKILEAATAAADIVDRMAAASEELSAQVQQVSVGAHSQNEQMESTASAMNQMNSTVMEVARNASQASEQSDSARQLAEEGSKLVANVIDAITALNEISQTQQAETRDLGEKAESIGGVMNVISDIADQTNLLALNAAIEAARAGEAGRGFAVVADEVRKLAEKTMSATHEVGRNITAIQQSTRNNIEQMGAAAQKIGAAVELANSSGKALQEIVDTVSSTSAVVGSIATAAEQQSATSEAINRSIEEVTRVVSETAAGTEQSNAAVRDLSEMAQRLRGVMEGLQSNHAM